MMSNTAIYVVGGLAAAGIGLAAYDFLSGGQLSAQIANLQSQQQTLQGTGGPTFNIPIEINPAFSPTFTPSYQVSAPTTTTISPNVSTVSNPYPGGVPTGVPSPTTISGGPVTTVALPVLGGTSGGGGGGSGGVITLAYSPAPPGYLGVTNAYSPVSGPGATTVAGINAYSPAPQNTGSSANLAAITASIAKTNTAVLNSLTVKKKTS